MRKAWAKEREHRTLTGRPWRRLRDQILIRDCYTCQACRRVDANGMEVDHKVPLSKGGTDDPDNLQCLCVECHERKSSAERGESAKVSIGLDGWPL